MTDQLTKTLKRSAILLTLLIAFVVSGPLMAQEKSLVVFAVRHAEKLAVKDTDSQMMKRDPDLSEEGLKRAEALKTILSDIRIDGIYSSNYKRTRNTAGGIAEDHDLEVQLYNPGNLQGLVSKLKKDGGTYVVVGHSNTTPTLVKLLGGDPHGEIQENEYDRLYVITVLGDEVISSLLLRFGD